MPTVAALDARVRELLLLDEELLRCVRQRDAVRLAEMFYASNTQIHAPGMAPHLGREGAESYWSAMFHGGLIDCRREAVQVEAEHELAWSTGQYHMTMETHPGMLQVEHSRYLTVYRRQPDGCWRVLAESLSRGE